MPNRPSAWLPSGTVIGYTERGRAIRFIAGGADDNPPAPTPVSADPTPAGATPPVEEPLGAPGLSALQRERERVADLEKTLAEIRRDVQTRAGDYEDLKAKAQRLDEIEAANATDLEKAVKAADQAARADVTARTNKLLVGARIEAAAAHARFNDPADAVIQLHERIATVPVDANGNVDPAVVNQLVDDLAKAKPYLIQKDTRPQPLPGQGLHTPSRTPGSDAGKAEAHKRFGTPPATQS